MGDFHRKRPLTQRELEEIAEDMDLESVADHESDTGGEDCFGTENVSETEDNLEIGSEEDSDEELTEQENTNEQVSGSFYTAKSGMIWYKQPFLRTRRMKRNILNTKPGITQHSADANTILETFNLFLTPEIKDIICLHTNQEASRCYDIWNGKNPTNQKQWTPFERDELDCFLGVLIKAGALRCRKESTKEMWTTNTSIRRAFFTASLSRNRFEEISIFLRFDDKSTRAERRENDKLAAIRKVWDLFVTNCQKSFEPYDHVTIDEQLVCFRGKCPFRMYIKSKPGRYGIKIWAAADVQTSYLCNLQVYTGKLPGNLSEKNQGYRVVSDLVQPYHGSGRGITTDNFFTSVALANYLLSKNLTLLGTVRKNKPDTPATLNYTSRPIHSSMFAFTKDLTMVSYIPKKGRMVHLLSSQHDEDKVSEEDEKKPIMILDYNQTKGGVDNSDKLVREFSCSRRTARWPYRLFLNIIDICTLNAYVIYMEKYPDWKKKNNARRRLFLHQLSDDLARNNMETRAQYRNHKEHTKAALRDCGIAVYSATKAADEPANQDRKRARCFQCPRRCDKKVNTRCDRCKQFVCQNHRITKPNIVCTKCASA